MEVNLPLICEVVLRHRAFRPRPLLVLQWHSSVHQCSGHVSIGHCSALRFVRRAGRCLDEQQPVEDERRQDSADLGLWFGTKQQLDKLSMTDLDLLLSAKVRFSIACSVWPGCSDRQPAEYGWPRRLTVMHVPVSTASTSSHAVIAERGIRKDTGARVCHQPSRLLQQPAIRCQRRAAVEVMGHSEWGRTSGVGSKEVRSYHPCASRTSLAARPPTHSVQAGDDRLQVSPWVGATIPGWRLCTGLFCG